MRDKMRFAGKLVGAGALTVLLATAAVAAPAQRNSGQWGSGRNAQQRTAPQTINRAVRQPAQQLDTRGQGNYGRGQQANYGRGQQANYGRGQQANYGRGQQVNVYRGRVDTRGRGNYGYRQPGNVLQVVVGIGRQGNYGYGYGYQQQGILSGVVEQINYRIGTMVIQDQATGRFINIDMQRMGGVGGLRSGEFVTVSGQWEGGNTFAAYQIS